MTNAHNANTNTNTNATPSKKPTPAEIAAGAVKEEVPLSKKYPNTFRHISNILEDQYDVKASSIIESAQFSEMGISEEDFESIKSNMEMTIGKALPKMSRNTSIATLIEKVVARTGSKDIA